MMVNYQTRRFRPKFQTNPYQPQLFPRERHQYPHVIYAFLECYRDVEAWGSLLFNIFIFTFPGGSMGRQPLTSSSLDFGEFSGPNSHGIFAMGCLLHFQTHPYFGGISCENHLAKTWDILTVTLWSTNIAIQHGHLLLIYPLVN